MIRKTSPYLRILGLAVAAALAAATIPALAAQTYQLDSDKLTLHNLIGEVTVTGHDGDRFEVVVEAKGRDADALDIEVDNRRDGVIRIHYPSNENEYVYPPLGSRNTRRFTLSHDGGGLAEILGMIFGTSRHRITVRGSGTRGLEVWADVTIKVPEGRDVVVRHGLGTLRAQDVRADVVLDMHTGAIEMKNAEGRLLADTGSGRVHVEDVRGNLVVDTGSGSVSLARIDVFQLVVDTGSGDIDFEDVRAEKIVMDTGSGGVRGVGLDGDSAIVDTGSGSIEIAFNRVGGGRFVFDTGSGGVRLALPADTSARIRAETGSGGITIDFPNARIERLDRHDANLVLGSGEASFVLDTGSGGVRITQSG